jgi:hypothetical protein
MLFEKNGFTGKMKKSVNFIKYYIIEDAVPLGMGQTLGSE